MAAKKNNPKREARMAKNNRNLNSALTIFTAGFIAEFYLLLINAYYVKGTVDQLVAVATYLEVMAVIGAAVLGAGIVLTAMRKKWTRFETLGRWLLGIGAFLAVSSYIMRKIYPAGTTAMCVLVPVVMLLSVVLLLYQHEFTVQAVALTVTIAASALLSRSGEVLSGLTKGVAGLALVVILVLLAASFVLQKGNGVYKEREVFPQKTNYGLLYAVLVLCALAVAVSLTVAGAAYYVIWGSAVALFALAVWYTVKML